TGYDNPRIDNHHNDHETLVGPQFRAGPFLSAGFLDRDSVRRISDNLSCHHQ
ncbi:uncharacterized protein H6S33_010133, partial [Morchella sextelata]|uniref:uncharacterized protein n=1 Tax=Morchella sextelata TaxID=1174677 RepID=UPI001D048ECA